MRGGISPPRVTYCGGPHFSRVRRIQRILPKCESRRKRGTSLRSGRFTCELSRVWRAVEPLPNFYRGHRGEIPSTEKEGTGRWTRRVVSLRGASSPGVSSPPLSSSSSRRLLGRARPAPRRARGPKVRDTAAAARKGKCSETEDSSSRGTI